LVISSQAFGLIHKYEFGFAGYFDLHALLSIIYFGSILFSLNKFGDLRQSNFLFPYIIIMAVGSYGILFPYFKNFSSLFYAMKEAKEYFNYLAYFSVFLFVREEKEIEWCWKFLMWFAVYFSALEIVGNVTGGSIFKYLEYRYRPEQSFFIKVYFPIFPIIVLSFFLVFYRLAFGKKKIGGVILFFLYSLGILFTFFRAYILSASAAIPVLLLAKRKFKAGFLSLVIIFAFVVASILFINTISGAGNFKRLFNSFIISGIDELYHYKGGALKGRDRATEGRMDLVKLRPWSGWGFLDKDSKVGKSIKTKVGPIGAGEIGFIDKGYLDVVAKFGILGAIIFYSSFLLVLVKLVYLNRFTHSFEFKVRLFSAIGLTLVLLCVQLTHASLTRQFGILPLSIVLALIDREYLLNRMSNQGNQSVHKEGRFR
jgi:hypothetical protein